MRFAVGRQSSSASLGSDFVWLGLTSRQAVGRRAGPRAFGAAAVQHRGGEFYPQHPWTTAPPPSAAERSSHEWRKHCAGMLEKRAATAAGRMPNARQWSRRQESNLHLSLRRTPFYPLNYGEKCNTPLVANQGDCGELSIRSATRCSAGRCACLHIAAVTDTLSTCTEMRSCHRPYCSSPSCLTPYLPQFPRSPHGGLRP